MLKDGGEVDLDLGNYERFLNVRLTRDHNITTGKVYSQGWFHSGGSPLTLPRCNNLQ